LQQKWKRRRRSAAFRVRIAPTGPNTVWSMDFMHDRLMGDRRQTFRILTILDIVTRECLALEVAPGFRAASVVNELSRIVQRRGAPIAIRCDQGTEYRRRARSMGRMPIKSSSTFQRPGKPTDNAFIESLNASVPKELFNTRWFDSLQEARRASRECDAEYTRSDSRRHWFSPEPPFHRTSYHSRVARSARGPRTRRRLLRQSLLRAGWKALTGP